MSTAPDGIGLLTVRRHREPDFGPGRVFGLRRRVVVGLVAGFVGITVASAVTMAQELTLPAVTGSSIVGRTELALTDDGRADPFATDGRARELAVWIWYPAVTGSSGTAAPYLPPTWADLANGAGIVSQDLNAVGTNAIADAPLDGAPPVVVLLPGPRSAGRGLFGAGRGPGQPRLRGRRHQPHRFRPRGLPGRSRGGPDRPRWDRSSTPG